MDELELAAELDGICHRSSRIPQDEHEELHKSLERWRDRDTPHDDFYREMH